MTSFMLPKIGWHGGCTVERHRGGGRQWAIKGGEGMGGGVWTFPASSFASTNICIALFFHELTDHIQTILLHDLMNKKHQRWSNNSFTSAESQTKSKLQVVQLHRFYCYILPMSSSGIDAVKVDLRLSDSTPSSFLLHVIMMLTRWGVFYCPRCRCSSSNSHLFLTLVINVKETGW